MDHVTQIIEDIKVEKKRSDKIFTGITFEIRSEQVIMFFNYDEIIDNVEGDQVYVKHNHDPEFIDTNKLRHIKQQLEGINVEYTERRDDFL